MSSEKPQIIENPQEYKGYLNTIIDKIVFSHEKGKSGKSVFVSSSPDRKRIVLAENSALPASGKPYKVKIIEDTVPDNPNKGVLVAEIVDQKPPLTPSEWKAVEEELESVEPYHRQANLNKAELYAESGVTSQVRDATTSKNLHDIQDGFEFQTKALSQAVENILGETHSYKRELLDFRASNVAKALKVYLEIRKKHKAFMAQETDVLRQINNLRQQGKLARGKSIELEEIRTKIKQLAIVEEQLESSSPEAFFTVHLKEMRDYKKALDEGKTIVETPYVQEKIERITANLQAGIPVMIYGHLGSGKTELAMHVAKEYILEQKPGHSAVVISGSKHTSLAELYGHQILSIDKINKQELDNFTAEVQNKFENWVSENQDRLSSLSDEQREKEKDRAHERILQTYLSHLKSGTISDFFLGPIYRAMELGVPVIIDEVNAIPHEVLISLNHILTRKPGDIVNVQQDSGKTIKVAQGFCVIMTGNLNVGQDIYVDRQDMDPAFLSRLYKIEYDYLPQKTEGSLAQEAGKSNELFTLLLTKIMDRQGNAEVPADTLNKLWTLAKAAKVIQNVFSGKEIDSNFYFQQPGGRPMDPRTILRENVLSMRSLTKILSEWAAQNYKYDLDFYIWDQYVSQSTNPAERAYLYQLLKDRFGFFTSSGWLQNPDYTNVNTFNLTPARNSPVKTEFLTPRTLVEAAYGQPPQRTVWPRAA